MRKEEEERNPEKCEDLDGSWSDDTEDGRGGERGGKTDAAEKDAACDAIVNTRQCVKCSTERLGDRIIRISALYCQPLNAHPAWLQLLLTRSMTSTLDRLDIITGP